MDTGKKKKSGRGGARPGAGRPKSGAENTMVSVRCPVELIGKLNGTGNRGAFIKESLERALEAGDAVSGNAAGEQPRNLRLPFFEQSIVAGFPVPLEDDDRARDTDLLALLCPHPETSYLVRVHGESMIDAGVESGDIVVVDTGMRDPSESEIAVCELNGEFTLKHFRKKDGTGWLVPANPLFPCIRITGKDEFRIWGTVTYIIHKARY